MYIASNISRIKEEGKKLTPHHGLISVSEMENRVIQNGSTQRQVMLLMEYSTEFYNKIEKEKKMNIKSPAVNCKEQH